MSVLCVFLELHNSSQNIIHHSGVKIKDYQNSVRTTKFHHQLVLWTSDSSIPVSTPDVMFHG